MMSLRAFEAAARHLSFTRAAIELNLTQTAISHQIKNLEDLLQVKLFVRNANMIALTEVGEVYLRSVRAAIIDLLPPVGSGPAEPPARFCRRSRLCK